jgi:hypothetical protein
VHDANDPSMVSRERMMICIGGVHDANDRSMVYKERMMVCIGGVYDAKQSINRWFPRKGKDDAMHG